MLTASTYENKPIITAKRKAEWRDAFLTAAQIYAWKIIAWVVLNNHYHAILESPQNPLTLSKLISSYHKFTTGIGMPKMDCREEGFGGTIGIHAYDQNKIILTGCDTFSGIRSSTDWLTNLRNILSAFTQTF